MPVAAFDDGNGPLQRGRQIGWVGDRPLAVHADAGGKFCEVDIGLGDGVADVGAIDTALPFGRHHLDEHDFLVVGAVVMNQVQQRNAVMCRRPQCAWGEQQVAVAADRYGQSPVPAMRERGTDAGAGEIAKPVRAGVADILVVMRGGPQLLWPVILEHRAVAQRPVLVADLFVELRAQAGGGNGLGIPADRRCAA